MAKIFSSLQIFFERISPVRISVCRLTALILMLLFSVAIKGWGQLIPFAENFSYLAGNLLGQGTWIQQGTDITNPIQVTAPGLYYPAYKCSGVGNAVSLGANATGQDLFNIFTGNSTINSGSVYIAALVKVVSASRDGDYFLSFKETTSTSLTVFKGRLYAKDSLGTGNLVFGVTKSTRSSTVPVAWTPQYFSFGTTYLVVLKYTFVADITNDIVEVFVCDPANPFPVSEPVSPNATATDAGSDGSGQRCVQLRQGGLNSATAVVDGIRVGQSWETAATHDIVPPVATFNPASGATNVLVDVIPAITFDKPVMKPDGSPLTNTDLSSLLTFKKTNATGADVAFTATIDASKTIITVTPSAVLLNSQLYYLAVGPVKDGAGNEAATQSATFTTIGTAISNDATLSDLKVNGTAVFGFSPTTYSYDAELAYGLPVPTVTAIPNYPLANAVVTQATTVPGTASVLVTAEDGITQLTYTVSFAYAPPSTNSALSYIKWVPNGFDAAKQSIRVRDFTSTTLDYILEIPSETVSLIVDAEPDFVIPASGCPPATYSVTQPVNLTGTIEERTATIVCTAQDGITTSTYHVTFIKASLTNVYVFKQGFDIMPPAGWSNTANVGSSTGNGMGFYGSTVSYQTPKFKWLYPTDGGTLMTPVCNGATTLEFFIKVLDKNASSNLHLYVEKSHDNTNWTLVSQDPMPLYVSITQWHQVVLNINDNSPVIWFRFRASATYGDNSTGLFYLDDVSLTTNVTTDATLSDLRVNGTTVAGFSPETLSYNVILPAGSTIVPEVAATTTQPGASKLITPATSLPGATTVLVTAPDGISTKTYTVYFYVALVSPTDLDATLVNPGQVDLAWNDVNLYESGFRIERKPNNGLFAQIATVGANVMAYSDNLSAGPDPDLFIPANRFAGVTVSSGVKFADVTNYKGVPTTLYLDVYQPAGDLTKMRPMIIWIHGGGFRTDSYRTQGYIVDYCTRFAKRGYVCMSIDYRLRAAADMPDQASEYPALQDAARDANAAVDWVRAHAEEYNIDPNLIFIAGGSAGGRTAQTVCQFDGPDPTAIYPPETIYLTIPWNKTGMVANATLWGGLEPEMRGWVYPVQPSDKPTILVHGTADVTILPQNSIDLYNALQTAGVASELHLIPGATHSCLGHETEISDWVANFFAQEWKKILCGVTKYTYRVCAYDDVQNSPYSNKDSVTVDPLPLKAGPVSGLATVTQGQTGVIYSIPVVTGATGYVWSLPAGATITSGDNTSSITVSFSATATSGLMTVYGTNSCGNGPVSNAFTITVNPSIPVQLTVTGAVTGVETKCYNATQTITVAGNNSSFLIETGGNATLIAGQNIIFLPGAKVQSGGYLWGYITTTADYCGDRAPSMIGTTKETASGIPDVPKPGFRIYPNPTGGRFTLEIPKSEGSPEITVEIFRMTGELLLKVTVTGETRRSFNIEGQPAGIYLLRVINKQETETLRIIKY
ncbi:MAG: alpha/beta hydrolase fold domain-containing protein [Bacteroidota bacterium]